MTLFMTRSPVGLAPCAVVIPHNWLVASFRKMENLKELKLLSKLQQLLGKQQEQKQRNVLGFGQRKEGREKRPIELPHFMY